MQNTGSFTVKWHLVGDLKTLKCMYNIGKGANSKSPCLYCMSTSNVLDKRNRKKSPNMHKANSSFQRVLNIPLSRVHICTMHALCQIIEKLVFLYINFAWTLQPNSNRIVSIRQLEGALSNIGLLGENVKLEVDEKRSKNGRSVRRKVSVNGVKARKFLSLSVQNEDNISERTGNQIAIRLINFNRWKTVLNAVVDHADNGRARARKAEVWKSLDIVFKYCDKRRWSNDDHNLVQMALENFKKSMLFAWIDQHITHYMVTCNCLLCLIYTS